MGKGFLGQVLGDAGDVYAVMLAATGDQAAAKDALVFVETEATRYNLSLAPLAKAYAQLLVSFRSAGMPDHSRAIFLGMVSVWAAVRIPAASRDESMHAVVHMVCSGRISKETFRHLGEHIPGAVHVAALAMDTNPRSFMEQLEFPGLATSEFLPKFAAALREAFPTR